MQDDENCPQEDEVSILREDPMDHDGDGTMNEANTSLERVPIEAPTTHERSESNDQMQLENLSEDELVRSSELKPC